MWLVEVLVLEGENLQTLSYVISLVTEIMPYIVLSLFFSEFWVESTVGKTGSSLLYWL